MTLFNFDSSEFLTEVRRKLTFDLDNTQNSSIEQAFFRQSILKNFDKKFLIGRDDINSRDAAIKLFLSVNARMHSYNMNYPENVNEIGPIASRVRSIVHGILGQTVNWEDIFSRSKHGPGSSLGVRFIDTSLERKMKFPLTGTAFCCSLWEEYKHWDFELYSQACSAYEVSGISPETSIVERSRAAIVPKTNKIGRLIAVEPTLNMFFQQGLSSLLTERLRSVGLSVERDPELHRRLAYEGSITGNYATIDFSSMSDSVSLAICHYLLPSEWYSKLYRLRSPEMDLPDPSGKSFQNVRLSMISTMGNATTFPLETLFLYAIAVACMNHFDKKVKGIGPYQRADCHVFGDDCILPTVAADLFVQTCSEFGFVTNKDKSFTTGPFRESCGGDFFHGRDVRPFYLKSLSATVRRRLDKESYLYTQINGVLRMYIKYFGTVEYVYGRALLSFLFDQLKLQTKQVKFVPEDFPEDSGITMLRDCARLVNVYNLVPSTVSVDEHGTLQFIYLSYRFPERGAIHEGLRYAVEKKNGFPTRNEDLEKINVRRKGGFYIATRGRSTVRFPSTIVDFWKSKRRISSGRTSYQHLVGPLLSNRPEDVEYCPSGTIIRWRDGTTTVISSDGSYITIQYDDCRTSDDLHPEGPLKGKQ